MATLKYTIAISSDDAFPQAVAFSRTSTVTIDGDSSAVGEREVGTTEHSLLPSYDGTTTVNLEARALIYIKNDGSSTDPNLEILVVDGDTSGTADVITIKGGEQAIFPYEHEDANTDIKIKASTGTAYYSYAFCELT